MSSPSQQVLRLGFGFAVSQALRVIIELGIPDLLAAGEQSVEELARATHSDPDSLYRVLRLLAPEGVVKEVRPRRFELTEVGAVLRSDRPGPRDFLRMINSEPYLAFEQLRRQNAGRQQRDRQFVAIGGRASVADQSVSSEPTQENRNHSREASNRDGVNVPLERVIAGIEKNELPRLRRW